MNCIFEALEGSWCLLTRCAKTRHRAQPSLMLSIVANKMTRISTLYLPTSLTVLFSLYVTDVSLEKISWHLQTPSINQLILRNKKAFLEFIR